MCSTATTTTDGEVQGGVVLIVRNHPQLLSVESARFHGPNVMSCEVVSGGKRTLFVGAYLPLSTLQHLPDLEEALTRFQ